MPQNPTAWSQCHFLGARFCCRVPFHLGDCLGTVCWVCRNQHWGVPVTAGIQIPWLVEPPWLSEGRRPGAWVAAWQTGFVITVRWSTHNCRLLIRLRKQIIPKKRAFGYGSDDDRDSDTHSWVLSERVAPGHCGERSWGGRRRPAWSLGACHCAGHSSAVSPPRPRDTWVCLPPGQHTELKVSP